MYNRVSGQYSVDQAVALGLGQFTLAAPHPNVGRRRARGASKGQTKTKLDQTGPSQDQARTKQTKRKQTRPGQSRLHKGRPTLQKTGASTIRVRRTHRKEIVQARQ